MCELLAENRQQSSSKMPQNIVSKKGNIVYVYGEEGEGREGEQSVHTLLALTVLIDVVLPLHSTRNCDTHRFQVFTC